MADFGETIFKVLQDSDVVRLKPGALVQFYLSGTETLEWEGTTNTGGDISIPSLPTGKYDIKIDGTLIKSFHHVKADHEHSSNQSWQFFVSGAISSDQDEVNTIPVFGTNVSGTIDHITVSAEVCDATGDIVAHLLKGSKNGSSVLTFAADSVWNHQINPGAMNRYLHTDDNPGISISAGECLTLGIDYVATSVAGLTVLIVFRPDE